MVIVMFLIIRAVAVVIIIKLGEGNKKCNGPFALNRFTVYVLCACAGMGLNLCYMYVHV